MTVTSGYLIELALDEAQSTQVKFIECVGRRLAKGRDVVACLTCGVDWSMGKFSNRCTECAGGALKRPCPLCKGRCGATWRRSVDDSHDSAVGHWIGKCKLPDVHV
jgi:hypothetical protein